MKENKIYKFDIQRPGYLINPDLGILKIIRFEDAFKFGGELNGIIDIPIGDTEEEDDEFIYIDDEFILDSDGGNYTVILDDIEFYITEIVAGDKGNFIVRDIKTNKKYSVIRKPDGTFAWNV
jgi:hypothetical protein